MRLPIWVSRFEIWVAIALCGVSPFVKEIKHGLPHALGSLVAIFAHSDEGGPVPGAENRKKNQAGHVQLAVGADKAVEIREFVVEAVADALDGVEGDAAHEGEAGDGGGLHIDQVGAVVGGEAQFFGFVGDDGTGDEPAVACAGIAVEALAGAAVVDSGYVVGGACGNVGTESADPAEGEDEVDGAAVFNGGEGAGGGGLTGSGAGGDPLFLLVALGPEADAVAGAGGPTADEGFELAGEGGDYG